MNDIDKLYEMVSFAMRSLSTIAQILKEKGIATDEEIKEIFAKVVLAEVNLMNERAKEVSE